MHGELGPKPPAGHRFQAVDQLGRLNRRIKAKKQVNVIGFATKFQNLDLPLEPSDDSILRMNRRRVQLFFCCIVALLL